MRRFLYRIIISCLLLFAIWFGGLCWFASQVALHTDTSPKPADAIVVLTGGSGRLETGINLLLQGKGKQLFVSGANQQVSYDDIVRLTPKPNRAQVRELTGTRIILGNNAENTIGNAQEVQQWLDTTQHHHILLITSNYHMPRALSELAELMPGKQFIPVAVIPYATDSPFWWLDDSYRPIILSEYYKYIISKLRHWAIHNVFSAIT